MIASSDVADLTPLIVIAGPTGSGKTAVALRLASEFPIEIISADSRQIIKYLEIGTAKPSKIEREAVSFHLLDIIEPGESYSAYRFAQVAELAIEEIYERGKIPLIVGGTGFYLKALTEGIVEIKETNPEIRKRLENELKTLGPEKMWEKLEKVDPAEAALIHPNNKVRVIRALEIFYLSGQPKSELVVSGTYKEIKREFDCCCLAPPRHLLYERINSRVEDMIAQGLMDELEKLIAAGHKEKVRSASVIGYSELLDHIDGLTTLDEAIANMKQNSRRFAKRQTTWFRKQKNYRFFDSSEALYLNLSKKLSGNCCDCKMLT